MNRVNPEEWRQYMGSRQQDPAAAERGRLLAAHELANNVEKRKQIEDQFGLHVCRQMYPEAYQNHHQPRIVIAAGKALDRFRRFIPW